MEKETPEDKAPSLSLPPPPRENASSLPPEMAEQILKACRNPISVLDRKLKIVWTNVNQANMKIMKGWPCYGKVAEGKHGPQECPVTETLLTRRPSCGECFTDLREGERVWMESHTWPVLDATGEALYVVKYFHDITRRKQAEEELNLLQTMTQAIGEGEDFHLALEAALKTVCESTGWILGEAWVPSHDGLYLEREGAYHAEIEGLEKFNQASESFKFSPGVGLPGRVWSSKKPLWGTDVTMDKDFLRGALAREAGVTTGLGIPVLAGKEVVAVMVFFLNEIREKDQRLIKLIANSAGQLGILFQRKQTEKKLMLSLKKLQIMLEGTVEALASTVAKRDPYTGAHQKRVTQLSCAIAREMKLPPEQIEGLRMAALLHDIGKIYIPAEILTRPGPLTFFEMELVKTHSSAGHDILKNISFPWPAAEIVLQHQERMDGSGYPLGLEGENIFLEARIIGVADVVESMFSHRPYRAARGLEKALEEIYINRDILYDAKVVDVCLSLFAEKGFAFENSWAQESG